MTTDKTLDYICAELQKKYSCHTIILYGSRARGEENTTSDYDVMGIGAQDKVLRDARLWNGAYLDLFIYPEVKIASPDESMLYMRGGRVLLEKGNIGTRFLKRLDEIYAAGPTKLREDEIGALNVWAEKTLKRIKVGDIEGNFRRAEFLSATLEHYFKVRGLWYRGPKESFHYLKENEPDVYLAFKKALEPNASIASIEKLIQLVDEL